MKVSVRTGTRRSGLHVQKIAHGGARRGNSSCGQFQYAAGVPDHSGYPPGLDPFTNMYYPVFRIYEQRIYRKSHKKHVDGIAGSYEQTMTGRKLFSELESPESRKKSGCSFAVFCEHSFTRQIRNDHGITLPGLHRTAGTVLNFYFLRTVPLY